MVTPRQKLRDASQRLNTALGPVTSLRLVIEVLEECVVPYQPGDTCEQYSELRKQVCGNTLFVTPVTVFCDVCRWELVVDSPLQPKALPMPTASVKQGPE
jgi:hypothetical protein